MKFRLNRSNRRDFDVPKRRFTVDRQYSRFAHHVVVLAVIILNLILLHSAGAHVRAASQSNLKTSRKARFLNDGNFTMSSRRVLRSHFAQPPLSPLQAYLYSTAAAGNSVALTQELMADASSATSQDATSPSSQLHFRIFTGRKQNNTKLADGKQRTVKTAQDGDEIEVDACRFHGSAAGSFFGSSAGTAPGAALMASLTGRYVVLSRTTLSLTVADSGNREPGTIPSSFTFRGNGAHSSSQRTAVVPLSATKAASQGEEGVLPTLHSTSPLREYKEKLRQNSISEDASVKSLSYEPQVRKPRLFPEEALHQLIQATTAPAPMSARRYADTGATLPSSARIRLQHSTTRSSMLAKDTANGSSQPQRQAFQQRAALPLSSASSTPASPLEVHVIDASHILVFLPSSEESAALLRAMAADAQDGTVWHVWDAFTSSAGGPQLKLSEMLRSLLEDSTFVNAEKAFSSSSPSSPLFPFVASRESNATATTYEVTLWTAQGRAAAVHNDLIKSARLQRYFMGGASFASPSPVATASAAATNPRTEPTCGLAIQPPDPDIDALQVRIEIPILATPSSEGGISSIADVQVKMMTLRNVFSNSSGQEQQPPQRKPRRRVSCLREVLLSLASHPAVRWVEESYRRPELLNSVATKVIQHGSCSTYSIGANVFEDGDTEGGIHAPMWELGFNGSGEIIGIADSGLDTESCYFRDPAEAIAYYPNFNYRHRKIVSYQPYVDENGVVDVTDKPAGHGTHVAGTASGCVTPSLGDGRSDASAYNGVAPGAKLFVRDMDGGTRNELSLPTNPLEIFATAYEAGVRISSNSWGFRTTARSYLAIERMFDATVAERRNLLILAAVGNSGKDQLYAPGRAKNVLTVGSHLNSVQPRLQNVVPEKSAYGITYDRRRKPDLVAPGGGSGDGKSTVLSAKAGLSRSCATTPHQGTSMATAAAAGAAAIVRQYLREAWGFADPSSALLRAALLQSTTVVPGEPLRSGLGRLDLSHLLPHRNHTVAKDLPPLGHWFVDDAIVHDDEVRQYCFTFTDWTPTVLNRSGSSNNNNGVGDSCSRAASLIVTGTLVWNDPGTSVEGSVRSQVHDLDLMLVTPNGYTFFSGVNGTTREQFNTVEQIRVPIVFDIHSSYNSSISKTSSVEWMRGFRVLVRGAVVRSAAGQTFALAVSGPGLTAVDECSSLFHSWRTAVPTSVTVSTTAAPGKNGMTNSDVAFCPMNCTNHGTCNATSLLCQCAPEYTSVDCAECNAATLCHSRGLCDTQTMTCACDPRGHFADPNCATCQNGWYGPLCASNCSCQHGGVCDRTTGLCSCVQDATIRINGKGCFQGPQCQYCCEGFGGPACNQRSYWCNTSGAVVEVDDPRGGFIQINDFKFYAYSLTCRWAIRGKPGQQIHLEFVSFNIEQYDVLYVYNTIPNTAATADNTSWTPTNRKFSRKIRGSKVKPKFILTSTAEQMYLEFVSDWDGAGEGFVLYYRLTSCSEKCKLTNLTGSVGHWRCGDAFGLPTKQCICEPPYVGWNCNEDGSDISLLNRELNALQITPRRAWQDGELAWMLPRSVLTAAEVRLPVQLTSSNFDAPLLRAAWMQWRSPTSPLPSLVVPVDGTARLPLIVHGFTEVQLPLLTLPSPDVVTSGSSGAKQLLKACLKLRVQLLVDAAWLDDDAGTLGLTLGVSAATEKAREARSTPDEKLSPQGDPSTPHFLSDMNNNNSNVNDVHEPTRVHYDDTATALSLNGFTFTPMKLQQLFYCADVPMIEITVPLNLLTNVPPANAPSAFSVYSSNKTAPFYAVGAATATSAPASVAKSAEKTSKAKVGKRDEETVAESHWTSRVIFTLLWKDVAGLKVPNASVIDAVVFAHEVVLTRNMPAVMATGELPAAGSTVRGQAVEISCHAVARVPVHTGKQVVEAISSKAAQVRKWSSMFRLLMVFFSFCLGAVGGVMWALWTQERHRPAYRPVQNTDDGQCMQIIVRRG